MPKYTNLIQSINNLDSQLDQLKLQLLDLDKPNSLLIVSNNFKNYDQLINCCKDNVNVIVFDQTKPFDKFKKDLNNIINESNQNWSLDNVGWVFDSLNQKSLKLSSDYVIDLTNKHNVKQYQQLIDFINGISKSVKSLNLVSKPRFDLISCDLDEEHYNHMIQILELSTNFDYAYSSKIIGNSESNINWSLDMLNNTTATESIDLTENYFNAEKLNNLESGSIILGHIMISEIISEQTFNIHRNVNISFPYITIKNSVIKTMQFVIKNTSVFKFDFPGNTDILCELLNAYRKKNTEYKFENVTYMYSATSNLYEYPIKYTKFLMISSNLATYIAACYNEIIKLFKDVTDPSNAWVIGVYKMISENNYKRVFDKVTYDPDGNHTVKSDWNWN